MKYNDKSAKMWKQREVDKADIDTFSSRRQRREMERNMMHFSMKVYKFVEREWWDSFTTDEKMSIYRQWSSSSLWSRTYGQPTLFDDWIKNMRNTKMPNLSIYREKKIEKIINE